MRLMNIKIIKQSFKDYYLSFSDSRLIRSNAVQNGLQDIVTDIHRVI